jgi:hypothetical protein
MLSCLSSVLNKAGAAEPKWTDCRQSGDSRHTNDPCKKMREIPRDQSQFESNAARRGSVVSGAATRVATHVITTINSNIDLFAVIRCHDALSAEWDRLSATDEDHPDIPALSLQCCALEVQILLAPACTVDQLKGKRRVVERGGLCDDFGIVDTIFLRDAPRVAAE